MTDQTDAEVLAALRQALDAVKRGETPDNSDLDAVADEDRARIREIAQAVTLGRVRDDQLKLYFENAGVGLFEHWVAPELVPEGGEQTVYSNEMLRMLGYAHDRTGFPNDLSSFLGSLHPDDKDRVEGAFGAHLMDTTGRTPYYEKFRMRRSDGSYVWVQAAGGTQRDSNGNPLRACGSTLNIDQEQKSKEDARIIFDRATGTASEARTAQAAVKTGQDRVEQIQQSINGLLDLAKQISALIVDIQGIAKQTNLLALNATIESARAGEAGKGFAVVASEVKALAQTSSDTSIRITEIVDKVQDTSELAANEAALVLEAMSSMAEASASVLCALEEIEATHIA